MQIIFSLAVLVMSVVVHEVSHGYVANLLGDPTARYAGRLTLNPLKHLDPFGSVLLPLLTYPLGFVFGYARPVPYNPYNLRGGKWGPALVGAAGPLANLALALLFGIALRYGIGNELSVTIVVTNLVLALFNLVPVPPLDGSKVLFALIPYRYAHVEEWLTKNQLFLVALFVFFGWQFLLPIVEFAFRVIVG